MGTAQKRVRGANGAMVMVALALMFSVSARGQTQSTPAAAPANDAASTSSPDSAAESQSSEAAPTPVPIVTGFGAFVPTWQGGSATLVTILTPVVLVPIGQRWLVESRGSFEDDFQRPPSGGPFGGPVQKTVDYVQLDFLANRYVTVTAGRFLTPFGIFNERMYPNWIRRLQTDPLILPIEQTSSNGAMLRGGIAISPGANLNYSAFFSAASTVNKLESQRALGGRLGIFFTGPRLEIGGTLIHVLQDDRTTMSGVHLGWQPRPLPLDLRGEFAYSENGKGYWLEGGYMLSQLHIWQRAMRHTQVVARMQNFYLSRTGSAGAVAAGLPDSNTARFEFGANYFLKDGLKAFASYGRSFSSLDGNSNIWTAGMAYRFAFPLGRPR